LTASRVWNTEPGSLPAQAAEIIDECGRTPLALAMIGSMIRAGRTRWPRVLRQLRRSDLQRIRADFPEYPYPDLLRAIEVSVEDLPEVARRRYADFAVFPEDVAIPEAVLRTVWQPEGLAEDDVAELLGTLVDRSLLRRERASDGTAEYGLHDLQYDFVRHRAADTRTKRHRRLLKA